MRRLAVSLILVLFTSACGVTFSEDFEGTELFKTVWLTEHSGGAAPAPCDRQGITWECRAGIDLDVNIGVTNGYPVPVRIACYYEDPDSLSDDDENLTFAERATLIGEVVLAAQPGRRPDEGKDDAEDLTRESFRFTFPARPQPGSYFVACLTPAAPDNGLGVNFRVVAP